MKSIFALLLVVVVALAATQAARAGQAPGAAYAPDIPISHRDTLTNKVIATSPIGQAAQAIVYIPNAVPSGPGTDGLQPLGVAGQATHFVLVSHSTGRAASAIAPTSVSLFDQGIVQILEAAVTGLQPRSPYVLALSRQPNGGGALEPIASFMTNAAGSQIVNATGLIRQIVRGEAQYPRRYFVIVAGTMNNHGSPVQVQSPWHARSHTGTP